MYGFLPYIYVAKHHPEVSPEGAYIRLFVPDGSECGKTLICIAWDKGKNDRWRLWLRLGWRIGAKYLYRLV